MVSNWRTQRTEVQSLATKRALGSLTTGLAIPPPRDSTTPFTPRTSSLAFHPREMVYAVGSWDGTGAFALPFLIKRQQLTASVLVRITGCKLPSVS